MFFLILLLLFSEFFSYFSDFPTFFELLEVVFSKLETIDLFFIFQAELLLFRLKL